jgi:hypothetical protein
MENIMELENLLGQMVVSIEENGKIVENMEMENLLEVLVLFMKGSGKMEDIMERGD